MYHFDYCNKWGGTVFENLESHGRRIAINGKNYFSFDDFINTFVLIENYKHPFTITTTAKRSERIDRAMLKLSYIPVLLKQVGGNMGEYTVNQYGYYYFSLPNPFRNEVQ